MSKTEGASAPSEPAWLRAEIVREQDGGPQFCCPVPGHVAAPLNMTMVTQHWRCLLPEIRVLVMGQVELAGGKGDEEQDVRRWILETPVLHDERRAYFEIIGPEHGGLPTRLTDHERRAAAVETELQRQSLVAAMDEIAALKPGQDVPRELLEHPRTFVREAAEALVHRGVASGSDTERDVTADIPAAAETSPADEPLPTAEPVAKLPRWATAEMVVTRGTALDFRCPGCGKSGRLSSSTILSHWLELSGHDVALLLGQVALVKQPHARAVASWIATRKLSSSDLVAYAELLDVPIGKLPLLAAARSRTDAAVSAELRRRRRVAMASRNKDQTRPVSSARQEPAPVEQRVQQVLTQSAAVGTGQADEPEVLAERPPRWLHARIVFVEDSLLVMRCDKCGHSGPMRWNRIWHHWLHMTPESRVLMMGQFAVIAPDRAAELLDWFESLDFTEAERSGYETVSDQEFSDEQPSVDRRWTAAIEAERSRRRYTEQLETAGSTETLSAELERLANHGPVFVAAAARRELARRRTVGKNADGSGEMVEPDERVESVVTGQSPVPTWLSLEVVYASESAAILRCPACGGSRQATVEAVAQHAGHMTSEHRVFLCGQLAVAREGLAGVVRARLDEAHAEAVKYLGAGERAVLSDVAAHAPQAKPMSVPDVLEHGELAARTIAAESVRLKLKRDYRDVLFGSLERIQALVDYPVPFIAERARHAWESAESRASGAVAPAARPEHREEPPSQPAEPADDQSSQQPAADADPAWLHHEMLQARGNDVIMRCPSCEKVQWLTGTAVRKHIRHMAAADRMLFWGQIEIAASTIVESYGLNDARRAVSRLLDPAQQTDPSFDRKGLADVLRYVPGTDVPAKLAVDHMKALAVVAEEARRGLRRPTQALRDEGRVEGTIDVGSVELDEVSVSEPATEPTGIADEPAEPAGELAWTGGEDAEPVDEAAKPDDLTEIPELSVPPLLATLSAQAGVDILQPVGDDAWLVHDPRPFVGGYLVVLWIGDATARLSDVVWLNRAVEEEGADRGILVTAGCEAEAAGYMLGRPISTIVPGSSTEPDEAPVTDEQALTDGIVADEPLQVVSGDRADLVDRLLASTVYAEQRLGAGRGAFSDEVIRRVLEVAREHGGRVPSVRLADTIGDRLGNAQLHVAVLRRMLNVDGYDVVRDRLEDGLVVFDLDLLRTQFEV